MHADTNKELLNLAEKIGLFIEHWGFKQVHGKVWTLIFLAPAPVDAKHLIKNLQISKALASMTIKDLLFYNVIQEVPKLRPGTQKYKTNPDIIRVISDILNHRERQMLSEIQSQCETLANTTSAKPNPDIEPQRLAALGEMVRSAQLLLDGMTQGQQVNFKSLEETLTMRTAPEADL